MIRRVKRSYHWAILALLLAAGPKVRAADTLIPAEYRLAESLGHHWTAELISFPVTFSPGVCRHIGAVTADGEPVLFQTPTAEITRHPDQSLATARVYVLTDLQPKQTILFRVEGSTENEPPRQQSAAVQVTTVGTHVALETAKVGIKVPFGAFVDRASIPAPYQGFRLVSGRWIGGSELIGQPGPERLDAVVTERGPLFAEALLSYAYPQNRKLTVRCRVIAGESVALFAEEAGVEPGCNYHRNLNYDYSRFVQGRFGYSDSFEKSHWIRVSLDGFNPDIGKRGDPWHATLFPWGSWHGGSMIVPLADQNDSLGLLARRAGHWHRPLENLGLVKSDKEGVYFQLPINDGRREWGIYFGSAASIKPTGEEPPKDIYPGLKYPSPLHLASIKYGQLSLDVVKDWKLTWKDVQPVASPVTISPPGAVPLVRQRVHEDPVLSNHAAKVEQHWERFRKETNFPFTTWWILNPEGVEDAYLSSGRREHARELYDLTLGRLRFYTEQTLGGVGLTGYRQGHGYGMFHLAHVLIGSARHVDLLLGSPHLSEGDRTELRAHLAFFACLFLDPDYWPLNEIPKGPYDMIAAHDNSVGLIGAVLAGHPSAQDWLRVAADRIEDMLKHYIHPSGAMEEGMHYSGVTLDFALPVMAAMKLCGGRDYFQDARLKQGLRWYTALLPPVDKRFGFAYMPPFGYSHPTATSMSVRWAVVAAMTVQSDPEFAGLMMRTWRQQGSPLKLVVGEAGYQSAFALGLIDPTIPPASGDQLRSSKWERFGAVLRNHADSPLETFMAIPTGAPDGFRAYPNEGTFHLYAKGAPLCLRFGARSYNDTVTQSAWMNNRITFDARDESQDGTGGLREWRSLSAADLFAGEYRFTRLRGKPVPAATDPGRLELSEPRLVKTKETGGVISSFFGDEEDVPLQTWRRQILFVKDEQPLGPNYFLVLDSFEATLPTDWSLWCLADDLEVHGQRATFTGKFGVDLEVYSLTEPQKIVSGAWGPEKERQKLLQFQKGPNQEYAVVLYPRSESEPIPAFSSIDAGHGVCLKLPDRTDWAFLAPAPIELLTNGVHFQGRAGVAQKGQGWMKLTLLDGQTIGLDQFAITRVAGDGGLTLRATLAPDLKVEAEAFGEVQSVRVRIPEAWEPLSELLVNGRSVKCTKESGNTYIVRLTD